MKVKHWVYTFMNFVKVQVMRSFHRQLHRLLFRKEKQKNILLLIHFRQKNVFSLFRKSWSK